MINSIHFFASSIAILLLGSVSIHAIESQPENLQYNRDIRPILSHACFTCHGPDAAARKAELRLDFADDTLPDRRGNLTEDVAVMALAQLVYEF